MFHIQRTGTNTTDNTGSTTTLNAEMLVRLLKQSFIASRDEQMSCLALLAAGTVECK